MREGTSLMIISLALSVIAIASGTLLTYTYDEDAPLASRLCSGACIGFALLGLMGFVLALLFGLTAPTLIATALLLRWLSIEPWPPFYDSLVLMFQREVALRIVAGADDEMIGA